MKSNVNMEVANVTVTADPACENFSQLAMESPEAQAAATTTQFDQLFAHLEPPDSETEKGYRIYLFEVKNGYKRSRYAFGEALFRYWFWSEDTKKDQPKSSQKTTFASLCNLIGVERRTAYNIISDYERAKDVPLGLRMVAETLNIDLAERRNANLTYLLAKHPPLALTENATAVFQRAQEKVAAAKQEREEKSRLAQEAEAKKSNYTKLLEFVADLYEGTPVTEFRKDMEQVVKYLTSYSRADNAVPSLEEAHEKNRAKAA